MSTTHHKLTTKSRIRMNTNKSIGTYFNDGLVRIISGVMTRIAIDVYVWLVLVCGRYGCVEVRWFRACVLRRFMFVLVRWSTREIATPKQQVGKTASMLSLFLSSSTVSIVGMLVNNSKRFGSLGEKWYKACISERIHQW